MTTNLKIASEQKPAAQTRGEIVAADIAALLRARNPLIWIVTREEARVESYLFEIAASVDYIARTWDVGQGPAEISGKSAQVGGGDLRDPDAMFGAISARADNGPAERCVWIMRDLPAWLTGPAGVKTLRLARNLARMLPGVARERAQAVIILSPSGEVPPELANHATVVNWPLPDREEIASILDAAIESMPDNLKKSAAPNGTRDAAIDAAVGLSGEEAAACYARSLVQHKRIDPQTVANEKKRVIAREGGLKWYDPLPGGLDAVGGLEYLKTWLLDRSNAWSPKAREYGLPAPKGAMLVGMSGCGKTLTGKAIATAWQVPLLWLDLNALKDKFVGGSEGKLRRVLDVIQAIGRCVVVIDEIEKSLQGATSGSSDGGVSADALGTILSWMQERQGEAFVIATANDPTSLPPELMRKGRFDEVWWIDLPNDEERGAILSAAMRSNGRGKVDVDVKRISKMTEGFNGAEIAALIPDALFKAFADDQREIKTQDIIEAARNIVPLSEMAKEKIAKLREWAKGRARPASRSNVETESTRKSTRSLDI